MTVQNGLIHITNFGKKHLEKQVDLEELKADIPVISATTIEANNINYYLYYIGKSNNEILNQLGDPVETRDIDGDGLIFMKDLCFKCCIKKTVKALPIRCLAGYGFTFRNHN
jgi:hypothetical protein